MSKQITYEELPQTAKDLFSVDPKSLINEFAFYLYDNGNIDCWFRSAWVATWNGKEWE